MTPEERQRIEEAQKEYERQVSSFLKKVPEKKKEYKTMSGIQLRRVYTPLDIEGLDFLRDIGFPGRYPFTRGIQLTGYRTRTWTIRPQIGRGTAEETNKRYRYLIPRGITGLTLYGAGSQPISRGLIYYDSDDERVEGYVGKDNFVMDTLADLETLFEGIDLEKISLTIIGEYITVFPMFLALVEKRGLDKSKLRGTYECVCYGLSCGEEQRRESLDVIEYCAQNMPLWNTCSFKGRNIREGGCTAPQEIAINLAMGIDVVKAMVEERRLEIDQFAPRLSFMFEAHNDFLEEVAKFRAARRMWARIIKERFGAKDSRSWLLRFHVQTSGRALTRQQPLNNIARSAIHGLAAALGGAQSLHISAFDEAIAQPSEFSAVTAIRIQQIIEHETGVTNVIDPLGGSYCIETLTNELETEAQKMLDTIESMGGERMARPWILQQIRAAAYEYQRQIDSKEQTIVGLNEFIDENEPMLPFPVEEYNPAIAEKQISRLNRIRRERDQARVEEVKRALLEAFRSQDNIIPPLIEAAKAYLTLGEISDVRIAALGKEAVYSKVHYLY